MLELVTEPSFLSVGCNCKASHLVKQNHKNNAKQLILNFTSSVKKQLGE